MNKYEFFYKSGDSSDYDDPSDTFIVSFKAEDDFHAYVLILSYLLRDEIDDFSERDFKNALESLEDNFDEEITIGWIRKTLSNICDFPYNDCVELYYIKRNGKFIDKFDPMPDSSRTEESKQKLRESTIDY